MTTSKSYADGSSNCTVRLRLVVRSTASEGRTFTSVVEEGLRAALDVPAPRPGPVSLPTYGDPSARFLVDPADRDAVGAILDADGAR